MPRPIAAQKWIPNPTDQQMIDELAKYLLLAEQISIHFRQFESSLSQQRYDQLGVIFMGDPVKYPSAPAPLHDKKGREEFAVMCDAICFPPVSKSQLPHTMEE